MGKSIERQLRDVSKLLEKGFRKSVDKSGMRLIANIAIERIRERSRRGFGVDKFKGPQRRFTPLSEEYIEQRGTSIILSRFTSPSMSNVTRSGRMLAGLRAANIKTGALKGQITIKPTGKSREGEDNQDVANAVTEGGRPFLNLSKQDLKTILPAMRKRLVRFNKRNFK